MQSSVSPKRRNLPAVFGCTTVLFIAFLAFFSARWFVNIYGYSQLSVYRAAVCPTSGRSVAPFPMANKFHTCSLRSIFVHVHAAAKNNFHFICCLRSKLCEAFSLTGTPERHGIFSLCENGNRVLSSAPHSHWQYLQLEKQLLSDYNAFCLRETNSEKEVSKMFFFSCNSGCNTGCCSIWQILSQICGTGC